MSDSDIIIVFDTETTGFSPVKNEIVQLSYILYDTQSQSVIYSTTQGDDIVDIIGEIPQQTTDIHGITKEMTKGKRPIKEHIDEFIHYCNQANQFVGHNIQFDIKMIVGQIKKIIKSHPEETEKYDSFLDRFDMIGNHLPEEAYCTMKESQGICAEIRGTKRKKKEKLMEVHKLLFEQNVGGQLHNALVDISVTLRVFLKLTMGIDICVSSTPFDTDVVNVTNNNEICSLIKPEKISQEQQIQTLHYNAELITGLTILPDDKGIEEKQIKVQTLVKKIAISAVKNYQDTAVKNVLSKKKVVPYETEEFLCTTITICKATLKSGVRKGETCGRTANYNEFCGYHKEKNKPTKSKKFSLGLFSRKKKVGIDEYIPGGRLKSTFKKNRRKKRYQKYSSKKSGAKKLRYQKSSFKKLHFFTPLHFSR